MEAVSQTPFKTIYILQETYLPKLHPVFKIRTLLTAFLAFLPTPKASVLY